MWDYFTWILPYSRHPERYPIEKRYAKARSLVIYILRKMRFDLSVYDKNCLGTEVPCLYVGNHVSALDPLALIALSPRPISFIAKKETEKTIAVGRFIKAIDGLFLDRNDPFQAVRVFRAAEKNMKEHGVSYGIFPEGKRSKDPYIGHCAEFHPGSLKLAYKAKCPITIFAVFGTFHGTDKVKGRSFPLLLRGIEKVRYGEFMEKSTIELSDDIKDKIDAVLPSFIEEDHEYFTSGKSKKPAFKWWKNISDMEI